jgi:hypothetical protein
MNAEPVELKFDDFQQMMVKALNQGIEFKIIVLFHSNSDSAPRLPSDRPNADRGATRNLSHRAAAPGVGAGKNPGKKSGKKLKC